MSLKVGELFGELDLNDGPFNKKLKGAGSSLVGGLTKAAAGAAVGIGTAIAGGVVYSLMEFGKLEKGMNEVFSLMPGISQQAMGQMTDDVQALSTKLGIATDETVPALYQAISAGVPADNVFSFMETAGKAAIAGVTEIEVAVDGISSAVNAYGADTLSATQASDLMFTAVRMGKTTFEELSQSLFNVNPVAAALGVSFGDVTAALATMTAQGVPTSVATTQMRQMFVELSQAGGELDKTFQKVSGKSFKGFVAEGGNVQEALQLLEQYAGETGVGINDLFGSVEAGGAALTLTGKGTETFAKNIEAMGNSAGATETAFQTMDQGLSRSMDKIKANVQVMVQKVGEALAPFAADVAAAIEGAMPTVQRFSDKLNEIWGRKDLTVTAKLEASWDEFGKLNETTTEIKQNMEGVSYVFLSVGHAVMGLANLFGVALNLGAAFGSSLVVVFAGAAAAIMDSINAIAGGLQLIGFMSDEEAQAVQDWADDTTAAFERVSSGYEANMTAAEKSSAAATEHFKQMGLDFNSSIEAFTAPKPIIDGGPLANVVDVTAADVEWLKADLAAGGNDMMAGLGKGMWDQLPVVDGAAGAAKTTAATAGDVNLNPAGNSITTGMGQGMWAGKPQVDGAAGALRGAAASAGNVDLYSPGLWAAHGFAAGLTDGSLAVGEAAAGLARAAINRANAELANRSPSKEMMVVGNWAAQGFAVGLINGIPVVQSAMTKLINSSTLEGLTGSVLPYAERIRQIWPKFNFGVYKTFEQFDPTGIKRRVGSRPIPAGMPEDYWISGNQGSGSSPVTNNTFNITINAADGTDAGKKAMRYIEGRVRLNG